MKTSAALAAALPFASARADDIPVLGQGKFRYRVVPNWGVLGTDTPVNNCHGLAIDKEGHIILLTDHIKNNVIIYDKKGALVHKWGTSFPGAHGLSLIEENGKEILYITCLKTHKVYKTTLDGKTLNTWSWPESTGKYKSEEEYKPSWTLHLPGGDFFILDGYGKDFITRIGADEKISGIFGGQEGGITHWGPHGGMTDLSDPQIPTLLIAMSDQQHLLRLSLEGKKLAQFPMPGGNPRQIRLHGGNYFVAHLGDNWPKDRDCRGFISVLDSNFKVLSNIAGTPPEYDAAEKLKPMRHQEDVFIHPHDIAVDADGSLYVAQFASKQTYPIKLERV